MLPSGRGLCAKGICAKTDTVQKQKTRKNTKQKFCIVEIIVLIILSSYLVD
jgi:hypothetical protein